MKELTIGEKTNKELAEWMGISQGTFNNNKAKQLEKISYFAKYHLEGKKVIIDEVYDPIYDKNKTRTCTQIGNLVPILWNESNLDTVVNLVDKVIDYYAENDPENKILSLSKNTIRVYLGQGRNDAYGSPVKKNGGKLGDCCFKWCMELDNTEKYRDYRFFTPEEEEIKREVYRKWYGEADDQLLTLRLAYKSGEISKEDLADYFDKMDDDNNTKYLGFMGELRDRLGGGVAHVTLRRPENQKFLDFEEVESKDFNF